MLEMPPCSESLRYVCSSYLYRVRLWRMPSVLNSLVQVPRHSRIRTTFSFLRTASSSSSPMSITTGLQFSMRTVWRFWAILAPIIKTEPTMWISIRMAVSTSPIPITAE